MDGETQGIEQVGEVPVVRRRDRAIFATHTEAYRAGRQDACGEALAYAIGRLEAVPQYEDTRPWSEMITFLQDRIRDNGAAT